MNTAGQPEFPTDIPSLRPSSDWRFWAGMFCVLLFATNDLNAQTEKDGSVAPKKKKVAALVADWFKNSHPDILFTRIFQTYSRDERGLPSQLELVSVYRDLATTNDLSHKYAAKYGFRVVTTVDEALTLGTGKLAVDGVLISTEWAPYPFSDTGQYMYPHRRMFEDCVRVFKASGRVVPVFMDKHLADTWQDSQFIYDTAKEMRIPLMAGSSVPLCLLTPGENVELEAEVKQIVGMSYHTLTTYGFHGLEMVQALAERRKGGETGIKQVRCLTEKAVFEASGKEYDQQLFDLALAKLEPRIPEGKTVEQIVREPVLFIVDYNDGLRVNLFTLNGATGGWSAAWEYKDGRRAARIFASQNSPIPIRFDWQMKGVEDMILSGKPSWPVERTLMSSGTLDAALISKRDGDKLLTTPFLQATYAPDLTWKLPEVLKTKGLQK
jgi:hypothetical protein